MAGKNEILSLEPYYTTTNGIFYRSLCENVLKADSLREFKGKINLIFTSPPFPLNRKKKYGNLQGKKYISWLASYAPLFSEYLSEDGSIVLELGNAWNPGLPTTSTLPIETLLQFKKSGNFHLCQEFICFNPARLPSPVQWVNKERIRVKDAFTKLWWLSKSPRPKANNRRVLKEYSKKMQQLIQTKKYNAGRRPSEHIIGEKSFLKNNKGAIPSNVIIATNTKSRDVYLDYCRQCNLEPHPARMPEDIISFFIRFLTEERDWIMDPFAGSNTTGAIAEELGRYWISIDPDKVYADGSIGRFNGNNVKINQRVR